MTRMIALLLLSAAALSAYGQASAATTSKPNLTGTWIYDAKKSVLKIPGPTSMTLQIDQTDPNISFARTQTYGDQNFDWKLQAATDGQKDVEETSPMGVTTVTHVSWQGNALVLDQKISATDGTKINDVVTYTLEDNGSMLTATEKQTAEHGKGATVNKWVYDRKAQ